MVTENNLGILVPHGTTTLIVSQQDLINMAIENLRRKQITVVTAPEVSDDKSFVFIVKP